MRYGVAPRAESFQLDGFLYTQQWAGVGPNTRESDRQLNLARRANRLAHREAFRLNIDSTNNRQLFSACLFLRLLESSQAGIVLSTMGLRHDAATVLRGALEALIKLRACGADPDYLRTYADRGSKETLKRVRLGLSQEDRATLSPELRLRLETTERELEGMIKEGFSKEPSLEHLAEKVGLKELYKFLYRPFCASAHSESGALVDYLDVRGEDVQSFVYEPRFEYSAVYLAIATDFLLVGVESILGITGSRASKELTELRHELERDVSPWPGEMPPNPGPEADT